MKDKLRMTLAAILLLAAIGIFVRSYGYNIVEMPFYAGEEERLVSDALPHTIWEDVNVSGEVVEETEDAPPKEDFSNADIEKYQEYLSSGYAYSFMKGNLKTAYIQIFDTIVNFSESKDMAVLEVDELNQAFSCVMIDHPEIFYVNGYTYSQYTRGDTVTRLTFSPTYTCTEEERDMLDEECEKAISGILSGVDPNLDDYGKVKYLYEYIVHNTEYDTAAPDNQNILSVLLNGRSVCQGYSKTNQLLLNRLGIECTLVTGVVNESEPHSWNLVKMDGDYYYVDTTWGDASYQSAEGADDEWLKNLDLVNYDYLGVTTANLVKTHVIDNQVALPNCTATADNYYVREGTFLNSPDTDVLRRIFDTHTFSRTESLTIKCLDDATYDWLMDELITNSGIFNYTMALGGTVGYAQNDDALSLTLWVDE